MTLVERLRALDAKALRQAADEIEALHAMLTIPNWNEAQTVIAAWRHAHNVIHDRVEIKTPIDEEFLDRTLDSRKAGRNLFGRIYGVRVYEMLKPRHLGNGDYAPPATVRDLARMTEPELLREPNIARRTVNAVKDVLARHGLHLGMNV